MIRKIAVCDDEQSVTRQLSSYLKQYEQETGEVFDVFYFSSGEDLVDHMPRDTEILLLDIKMGGMTGIDAARALLAEGLEPYIFFITGNLEYALQGYEVHAYAFLQKPLEYSSFCRHITDALQRINEKKGAVLRLKDGPSTDLIPCDDLIYAEVFVHTTVLVTSTKRQEYKIPLGQIEDEISRYGFFRCHKSYLINLKKIIRVEPAAVIMFNGDTIPLSKHRRGEFMTAWARFMGAHI